MRQVRSVASRALAVLASVAAVALLAGCNGRSPGAAGSPSARPSARPSGAAPAPRLVLHPGRQPWDRPLAVSVTDGTLRSVTLTGPRGTVPGRLAPGARSWSSSDRRLLPDARYTVEAVALDRNGRPVRRTALVRTTAADRLLQPLITPGDGDVVGIGMPLIVTFNRAPADRAAVTAHLTVTASPAVVGAWHWMSPTEVHYRPRHYWRPGTRVHLSAALGDVYVGDGVWGAGDHTVDYRIGASHISVVDVTAHRMLVYVDGRVVRVVPVSTGRDKYPTLGGVHIVIEKSPVVTMDSRTVGIPLSSPDGYYEKVYWDVRISYGGAFVHAAPWSVVEQGVTNVSHGCVNVSPANAVWFYGLSRRGDIVDVVHALRGPDIADPGMSDWNMSWAAWSGTAPVGS